MRKTMVKVATAGAVTLGLVGIGAGVASAEPAHNPGQEQQWQHDQRGDNQNRDHHQEQQAPQPAPHGFWFFGTWIPLP